jgi:hypothetical protein
MKSNGLCKSSQGRTRSCSRSRPRHDLRRSGTRSPLAGLSVRIRRRFCPSGCTPSLFEEYRSGQMARSPGSFHTGCVGARECAAGPPRPSDEDLGRFFGGCLRVGPPRTRCHSELVHRQPARWRGGSRAPVVHTSADAGARPPIEVHGGIGSVRRLTRGEDDEYCDCVRRLRTGAGRHR